MFTKKILLSILLSSFIGWTSAQELTLGNFSYIDNSVTWQKVFESELSIKDMKSKAKSLPIINKVISEDENSLTIDCKRIDHDYRALGGTEMNTTIWVSRKSSIGNVVFQFKEGRYRVTFTNIILEQEYTVNAGMLTEKEGEQDPLAIYALKRNRSDWTGVFKNKDYKILDYTYSKVFDLSSDSSSTLDDDF
jgi:hypothetical protein